MANARKLAGEIGSSAKACSSVEEAVTDADIIVTVSFATTPVVNADWVKPGAHINGNVFTSLISYVCCCIQQQLHNFMIVSRP